MSANSAAASPVGPRTEQFSVSVVVVNLNGKDLLEPCLRSLVTQSHPADKVEIILIDNASTDGSVEMVRAEFPEVRILVNDTNVGFAPAVNQGAQVANGEFLALLNNDAVADPNWIAAAVSYLTSHEEVGCVASLILRDDRETIDYAGGRMAFNGMGYANKVEQSAADTPGFAEQTLFASGGAMVVPTQLFLDVGGFDETYFAFFEDVDFGWRLWVLGHEVHFVPGSRVYHRHHGTIKRFGYARERYLLERNALATIYKNYGEDNLARTLPGSVILTLMRGLADLTEHGGDLPDFSIVEGAKNLDDEEFGISALTAAHLAALRDFGGDIGELTSKRTAIQTRRQRVDAEILPLFHETLRPNVDGRQYTEVFDAICEAFDLESLTTKPRILIITSDTVSDVMAGPAIRSLEMARVLAERKFDVILGTMTPPTIGEQGFLITDISGPGALQGRLQHADVVIFQGFVMHALPPIEHFNGAVVVDLYDPFHLEGLTQRKYELGYQRHAAHNSDTDIINKQLQRGDIFVCDSEKQREFWLGQLSGLRRINPATFDHDESLRSLLDVAPFGIPSHKPVKAPGNVLRGVVPGIEEDDFLLLWGGGIYNWFDPLTLIKAVGKAAEKHPDIKLWFMGSAHPNPDVPKMAMAANAYHLAKDLGLLGTHVMFNEGWVAYDERQNYLLEADVGVSTHYEHLETRFSFRTRILDYLWCGLPILSTQGDTLSDLTNSAGLGLTIPPDDVDACAAAIIRMREDPEFLAGCTERIGQVTPEMTWHDVMEPIVRFCADPHRAADVAATPRRYIAADVRLDATPEVLTRSAYANVRQFVQSAGDDGLWSALTYARNVVRQKLASR